VGKIALGDVCNWDGGLSRYFVLRFPKRTVVLSPDPPEDFVQLLTPYAGNA
jgi:hypothetical protein